MNRTLLGSSEMSLGTDNQYFRTQSLTQKEVMSGSEVSTHPTENVKKIKRFFSQIKNIENFTFLKIIKFTTFSKGKLLFSKLLFTALTHIVRFSTRPVNIQWVQIMGFGRIGPKQQISSSSNSLPVRSQKSTKVSKTIYSSSSFDCAGQIARSATLNNNFSLVQ